MWMGIWPQYMREIPSIIYHIRLAKRVDDDLEGRSAKLDAEVPDGAVPRIVYT